jgi:hypothetical protein
MAVVNEENVRTHCVAGASLVALLHALTVAGGTYQASLLSSNFWNQELSFFLVNYSTFLAPCILVILASKSCLFVKLYAIPVAAFFCMRMYYVAQCWSFGINSMARQKGDELFWFTLIFEALSALIAGVLLIGLLLIHLPALFTRRDWHRDDSR